MESVRSVNNLDFVLVPKLFSRKPPENSAQRRMAVKNVIMVFRENLVKLPVRLEIFQGKRSAHDAYRVLVVAVLNFLLACRSIVNLPALLLEPANIRQIEL